MAKPLSYTDVVGGKAATYEKVGKVSAESVRKHTRKDWKTWVELLEKDGAGNLPYREIVALLRKKYRLSPWWQQGVALGFEIATGRRRPGQDAKGRYTVTATKSLHVDVKVIWKKIVAPAGIRVWLRTLSPLKIAPRNPFETKDGYFGEIRTMAVNRRVRMSWQDPLWAKPSVLEVHLVPRPDKKAILVFNHSGIPDEKTREAMRTRWRAAAEALAKLVP